MKVKNVFRVVAITVPAFIAICGIFLAGCGVGASSMNESSQNVTRISGTQFEAEVTKASSPVVVDFYATWCGPCRKLSPMFDQVAGAFTNKIKFVKVDVDEATSVAKQFNIEAIPTLIFFKNGKVADTMIGLPSEDDLKKHLTSLAESTASAGPVK